MREDFFKTYEIQILTKRQKFESYFVVQNF